MEINQVIRGILSVRERIQKNFHSPEALSDLAVKLAAYNAYLGDRIGELETELADEQTTKHLQYTNDGDLSDSAAKTRIKAEQAVKKAQQQKLKIMRTDTSNQISTIQSRLKVLADERRG